MENLKEYRDILKNLHDKIHLLVVFPSDLMIFFPLLAKFYPIDQLVFQKFIFELNKKSSKL